jgi:tRNA(fMet)-specific endonuclease VapC
MMLYVLDTDIAGFLQSAHPRVLQRLRSLPAESNIVTTIITFGEDLSGWMPACRRAADGDSRALAFARLQRGLEFYCGMICLPFDEAAAGIFDELRALRLRVGTSDLSIAAITLAVGGVLVTRNAVDFQKIPGVLLEDWTQ